MSNCTAVTIASGVQTFQIVTAIPTFILGVFVNVTVLVLFCRQWRNCTDMMVYLTNICLADITVLVSLPFRMYSYKNPWPFSVHSCLVFVSAYFVNMYVSIFTTVAISLARFIAVKFPFRARDVMSPWRALAVCVGIWVIMGCLSAQFHFVDFPQANSTSNFSFNSSSNFYSNYSSNSSPASEFRCFQKNSQRPLPLSFILTLVLVGYLLPCITIVFCSVTVIRTLSRRVDPCGVPRRNQSVRIIMANMAVFIFCFSPLHFGYLFKFLVETHRQDDCRLQQFAHSFVHVANSLASTNCFLDAFSYYFLARSSWGTVRDAFCGTQRRDQTTSTVI